MAAMDGKAKYMDWEVVAFRLAHSVREYYEIMYELPRQAVDEYLSLWNMQPTGDTHA